MRTGPLIVSKIALQSTTQRPLIPNDNVVQALASDGAHESFQKRILTRGSRRGEDFLYPHISGHVGKVSSIDGISIAPHVSWRLLPGKRFPHLLHRPLLRGVFRHPEVQYPASLMGKNDEDEQDPEGRRRHGEKINGRGLCKVIHQKGPPSLGRRFARPRQIFGHRGLRHLNSQNSQLEQFSVNPRCTPQGVAWCMRRMRSRRFAAISGLPEGVAISSSNARQKLCGASAGPCRAAPCEDIAANRTRIGTTQSTTAGRHGGGASDAARSFEKPQVDDEAQGSQPVGQHVFENWRLAK